MADKNVDIAANGEIGQKMLERKHYALLLIDIRMPVMNGRALYEYIEQKHPRLADRVVFTDGNTSRDNVAFWETANIPFLPKPFTTDELTAVVTRSLERRHRIQ